jgi:hypothetical protein
MEKKNLYILSNLGILFLFVFFSNAAIYYDDQITEIMNESAVLLIDSTMTIDYSGSVEDEFGPGLKDSLIREYLGKRIEKLFTVLSTFTSVKLRTNLQTQNLRKVVLQHKPDRLCFNVSFTENDRSINLKYAIYLKNIKIFSGAVIQTVTPSHLSLIPIKPLIIDADFLIWNRDKEKAARWGRVHCNVNKSLEVTMEDWEKVTRLLVSKIVEDSPFEKKVDLNEIDSDSAKTPQEIKKGKVTFKKLNKK